MATTKRTPRSAQAPQAPQSLTLALPIFAAVIAHIAGEQRITPPFAVVIQDGKDGTEDYFAIALESGRAVAIRCDCYEEAARIVMGRKVP